MQRFSLQPLPKVGLFLVVLPLSFSPLYSAECLDYWGHDCNVEFCLLSNAWGIFYGLQKQ